MGKKIRVLSLFDGISCGKVALERAGVEVDKYYASEINQSAIKISEKNHPTIIRLGDINNWKSWGIDLGSIDLVIGGSPCQGFSFLGKQLNFDDERSKLFFVYADILKAIRELNPQVKFLLENVRMKKECQDVITNILGVTPHKINSSLLSAAKRERLYWTNIPIQQPQDKGITFDDINLNTSEWLSTDYINKVRNWKAQQDPIANATLIGSKSKLPCLTARGYNQSHSGMILITDGERYRYLTNNEAELAMTLPIDYTAGVSDRERAACLGNGWTVDVIAHILRFMVANNEI